MGENGDSVLKVVQLFIDNINESTKYTTKELDDLGVELKDVKTKINTPPRHEELSLQIGVVETKVDTITNNLTIINTSIKSMINTVRIAAAVLSIAVLFAGGIIQYGKYVDRKETITVEKKIDDYLKEKEHNDGIISGTDGQH